MNSNIIGIDCLKFAYEMFDEPEYDLSFLPSEGKWGHFNCNILVSLKYKGEIYCNVKLDIPLVSAYMKTLEREFRRDNKNENTQKYAIGNLVYVFLQKCEKEAFKEINVFKNNGFEKQIGKLETLLN